MKVEFKQKLQELLAEYNYNELKEEEHNAIVDYVITICDSHPTVRSAWYIEMSLVASRISKGITNYINKVCKEQGIDAESLKSKKKVEN